MVRSSVIKVLIYIHVLELGKKVSCEFEIYLK